MLFSGLATSYLTLFLFLSLTSYFKLYMLVLTKFPIRLGFAMTINNAQGRLSPVLVYICLNRCSLMVSCMLHYLGLLPDRTLGFLSSHPMIRRIEKKDNDKWYIHKKYCLQRGSHFMKRYCLLFCINEKVLSSILYKYYIHTNNPKLLPATAGPPRQPVGPFDVLHVSRVGKKITPTILVVVASSSRLFQSLLFLSSRADAFLFPTLLVTSAASPSQSDLADGCPRQHRSASRPCRWPPPSMSYRRRLLPLPPPLSLVPRLLFAGSAGRVRRQCKPSPQSWWHRAASFLCPSSYPCAGVVAAA